MFTGFTDETVDFMWGIRFNNDRAWFAEHKQEFQDAVMAPTKALAAELYDWFHADYPDLHLNLHISRICEILTVSLLQTYIRKHTSDLSYLPKITDAITKNRSRRRAPSEGE